MLFWTSGQSDLDEYVQWNHDVLTNVLTETPPQATTSIYDHKINGIKRVPLNLNLKKSALLLKSFHTHFTVQTKQFPLLKRVLVEIL